MTIKWDNTSSKLHRLDQKESWLPDGIIGHFEATQYCYTMFSKDENPSIKQEINDILNGKILYQTREEATQRVLQWLSDKFPEEKNFVEN